MMSGGVMPAGSWRRIVCETAVTWALAVSRLAFGCKKILTIAWPLTVVDSRCSMLSTVVVRTRSKNHHRTRDEDQEREDDERVGSVQRDADDPHVSACDAAPRRAVSGREVFDPCFHVPRPE